MKLGSHKIISGNARVVRNVNRSVILNIIRDMEPVSRVQIAKLTGLNKSTVSSIVAALVADELIYEEESRHGNVGRNPISLRLKLGKHFVGAVNIDSARTILGIADIDGSFRDTISIATKCDEPERFVANCVTELSRLSDRLRVEHLEGIGVSVAGIVEPGSAKVTIAPNLGWEGFDIGKVLHERCGSDCVIHVDNDSKASALAELWFGKHGRTYSNFVFLSIGRGIGAGIVVEGKLLTGHYHASGEFGHITLFDGGNLCSCGNRGCWEEYASDRATIARYANLKHLNEAASRQISIQDVVDSALAGDEVSREVFAETGRFLGLGIANVIKAIDPEAIIIGGKITQVWHIIHQKMIEVVHQRTLFGKQKDVTIFPTSLPLRPELQGAAALVIKDLFSDYKIIL